ncbi:MAG: VanW family protein [Dermatophilaceae bacterium]
MGSGRVGELTLKTALALLVLSAAYVALAWYVSRQVPASVRVENVNVGGLSPQEATERISADLTPKARALVRVELADTGSTVILEPASAGLTVDVGATLDGMAGFTLDPRRVWNHLTEAVDRPVETHIDRDKLTAVVTERAAAVAKPTVEGSVSLAGGTVTATSPQQGVALNVADAVDKIVKSWPRRSTVTAAVVVSPPRVNQAAIDEAVRTFATPAMSAPVTLAVADKTATLTPAQLAPAITMAPDASGKLAPVFDRAAITATVVQASGPMTVPATEAGWVLAGDTPQLRPSTDGVAIDQAQAADQVIAALTAPDRTARLATTVAPPKVTTQTAQAWGVKEVVASFDSPFPYNPSRTANLTTAANTVNGTLVPPGGVFSLNAVLGERTADKGYAEGYVIEDGRLAKGTGGGVSQISTVVYNLAWFAGAELTAHTAHSFYISRYPEGREATVHWPDVDNRFTNATPYAMLVQMWVAEGAVHGRVWSTKLYDVEAVKGPRTAVAGGKTITDDSTSCVPQPEMVPGFTVSVQRVIRQGAAVVKTEAYTTAYQPEDQVVCTNPNHQS